MAGNYANARVLAILFTITATLTVSALLPFSKISVNPEGLGFPLYLIGILLAASIYCHRRNMLRLAVPLETLAIGLFIAIPSLVATYLAASLNLPLMDGPLMHTDAALGFHWLAFIEFVDRHPGIATILNHAYVSFGYQLMLLPLLLGAAGRFERAYVMILVFGLLCFTSSFISIWFPALGTYTVYGVAQSELHNINAYSGFSFLHDFMAVRQNSEFLLSFTNPSGIITFPSDHAAVALLCAWAAWDLKFARVPFLCWNSLMAVSAVSNGNHYLADVIAGVVIAALLITAVQAILRKLQGRTLALNIPALGKALLVTGIPGNKAKNGGAAPAER